MSDVTRRPATGARWAGLGDAWSAGMALAWALVVGGLVALGLGWRGAAATEIASTQVAFLVSGGAGGAALVVTGLVLARVQLARYDRALEREQVAVLAARLATRLGDARAADQQVGMGVVGPPDLCGRPPCAGPSTG